MIIVGYKPCFQGDLMIRRIDAVPIGMKLIPAVGEHHVLAHSETGHHHVIESRAADRFIDSANAFISCLRMLSDTELRHLRDYDTHESYALEAGAIYEIRNQREHTPVGWRRAAD
jgi:hypothetical protein